MRTFASAWSRTCCRIKMPASTVFPEPHFVGEKVAFGRISKNPAHGRDLVFE